MVTNYMEEKRYKTHDNTHTFMLDNWLPSIHIYDAHSLPWRVASRCPGWKVNTAGIRQSAGAGR